LGGFCNFYLALSKILNNGWIQNKGASMQSTE